MMRGSAENGRKKWLGKSGKLAGKILEKFLIPYRPIAIEIIFIPVFIQPKILLDTDKI